MLAVVDTGPLYAAVDEDDADHGRSCAVLERTEHRLIIPTLVIAETTYLIATRLGPLVEARFLRSLTRMHVEAPTPDDWPRIADLVEEYGDFPLGGVDASIVALAERLNVEIIVTLDDRHFRAIRPRHRKAFHLLP